MDKDSLTTFFTSKLFAGIVAGVGITLIAVVIFEAGVTVGYHQATFSARWGANYGKNFGATENDFGLPDAHLPSPDGTLGKIIRIKNTGSATSTVLTIASAQKPEQLVLVDSDTVIRDREKTITASDLATSSYIVVLGTPNDQGQIDAKLIRVVPAPASTTKIHQ